MNTRLIAAAVLALPLTLAHAGQGTDADTVAALDIAYQDAVLRNDADAMARIVHDDFTLVNGRGIATHKAVLLDEARKQTVRYEHQEVIDQSRQVRVLGDTAVVTAKLWIKGTFKDGGAIDKVLWFSDTYVRTPQGWKYYFGQASLALPAGG